MITTKRFWLHVPLGIAFALLCYAHWIFTLCCTGLFIYYERNEDIWLRDQAWKDVPGAIAGLILGGFVYWLFDGIL